MSHADEHEDVRGGRDRVTAVPHATSPQLLGHLLEWVARGVRTTRGLQEVLGQDIRAVRAYLQAAVWMGFLRDEPDPILTPEGLAWVYGGARRPALWAAAVEHQPLLMRLRARHATSIPRGDALVEVLADEPDAPPRPSLLRRAATIEGLTAPWRDVHETGHETDGHQLALPLLSTPRPATAPPPLRIRSAAFSPDLYRFVLSYLLDHGELSLGGLRAVLDRVGAPEAPIGPYVDLAIERGDATRLDDRLIVTRGAVQRRDLADSTLAIILTDGGWRGHLDAVTTGARPHNPARWRPWDLRAFGHTAHRNTLRQDLDALLRDRSLDAWPRTGTDTPASPAAVHGPFLERWTQAGLLLTLPPCLAQLWEGVVGINRRLRDARHRADAVAMPHLGVRPMVAHGGVLHPGEPLPTAIADGRSLRHRVIAHAPYVTLLVAALVQHRHGGRPQIQRHQDEWWLTQSRRRIGPVLEVLDAFATSRGWIACRRRSSDLGAGELLALLEHLGVVQLTPDRALLDDAWFHLLRTDEEEQLLRPGLEPLGEALTSWVATAPEA